MRVKMYPHVKQIKSGGTSGIDQVVINYFKYLPKLGVNLVELEDHHFDLIAGHIGEGFTTAVPYVAHTHGLHWTDDYECNSWQYKVNAKVISAVRYATETTVPSLWVAESFQRDMRFTPHVIPHGIDWRHWQHNEQQGNYILWNKNRPGDVCSPMPVVELARRFQNNHFVTTHLPSRVQPPTNVNAIGTIPHDQMKQLVQSCLVYLSTTKETFGIGVLEAMASGKPVLGFAYGGNVDLIEHGVSGYLAKPGDYEELAEGLAFCLEHAKTLGENGRELAKSWTWERACEMVVGVYEKALRPQPATVGVVIPVYNKSESEVRRAIESVLNQTYNNIASIVVVDDGSSDAGQVGGWVSSYDDTINPISFTQQRNSGVAIARNEGVFGCRDAKYICCLDADDAIEPRFIETCVNALERDPSLGIAYTGLHYIKPDGEEGLSSWPDEWDFDRQLRKQNQIPTCCVFRREMWERLGGYNQKYAPGGCGSEDAEYWLRSGAYGWKAQKVSDEGLFLYSWQSGLVSGNPDYVEIDWTALHPWAGKDSDGKHPFASYATPKRFSHPVRQYDEPTVSVIIPVGPGHENDVKTALDSLEHQTFRKWEVIVVWDTKDATLECENDSVLTTYPYIKTLYTSGLLGAGFARNRGAEVARAPFLVFLDADDWLYPTALQEMLDAWRQHESIIYTDYVGKAIIEDREYLLQLQNEQRLYGYNERTNEAVFGAGPNGRTWAVFDCELAQQQPLPTDDPHMPFYHWCLITSLIPKAWHDSIGGFDESMESWEDIDYHWRLAKAGYCYHRVEKELMVYRFHTGQRREKGLQAHEKLIQYLREKHERIEIKNMCQGCGGSKHRQYISGRQNVPTMQQQQLAQINDESFVLATYTPGRKGKHQVTGATIFPTKPPGMKARHRGSGWSIDYGNLQDGDNKLVHRDDIRMMPGKWREVEEEYKEIAPPVARQPLEVPQPIVRDNGSPGVEMPEPLAMPEIELTNVEPPKPFDLQKLPGIGGATARMLESDGIDSREKLEKLGVEGLAKYPRIGPIRARMIINAVEGLGE